MARRRRQVEVAWELARASLELRVLRGERAARLLGSALPGEGRPVDPAQLIEAKRVGATVAAGASRLPWHPTCLRQALAVRRMLGRRAIPSKLHLGVTSVSEGEAHAWVTVGDEAVIGARGRQRYVPLGAFG
ncbi:MAG TPA: lasso peptide biosynthesis B2 protein [Thermoleophilaceae bacterium]|nr:lasso peptide biosynthesis B2 protein [Thermoleophilaceae bacterium]